MLNKIDILGVKITNETSPKILEYILQKIIDKKKFYIVTPNPEIVVYARKHPEYRKILNEAEIALPDGSGTFLASIIMLKPFKQRIPGVEFVEELCRATEDKPISMGFLGGKKGVADRAVKRLKDKYPWINPVFIAEEWSPQAQKKEIDILFVAFGHPKQEEWIYKNFKHLPVVAAMGVGGAFDYISGQVHRAPFIVRAIGFEWLYRLIQQPWRWKRQLALLEFAKLVFLERFGIKSKTI